MKANNGAAKSKNRIRDKRKGRTTPSKLAIERDHLVLVFLSDTHLLANELMVPPGDLLIHSGDAIADGSR
jgi:hypothetical protein